MADDGVETDAFGVTDRGPSRDRNEDQFLIADLSKSLLIHQTSLPIDDHQRLIGRPRGQILVVADGMGGHSHGGLASTVAVGTVVDHVMNIMPWFDRLGEAREDELVEDLKAALQRCQDNVRSADDGDPLRLPMGTTLTMAYVVWPRLYVVHAGDSRCYLVRGSGIEQITKDHTVAQALVDRDVISPEKAPETRWSRVLWNTIAGGSEDLVPDVYKAELQRDDVLLLCSDGLTAHVDDASLAQVITGHVDARDAAEAALALAGVNGGSDNVTAVVARFH